MLAVLVAPAVVVGAFVWLGPEAWLRDLRELRPAHMAWMLALAVVSLAIRAFRWQLLCRHARARLSLLRNSVCYMAGFAFAITPGYVGELIRLWLLRRYHGYAYERTAGPMLLERLADGVSLVLLGMLGVSQWLDRSWALLGLALALVAMTAVVLHPSWLRSGVKLAYARLRRAPRLFARLLRALRVAQSFADLYILAAALVLGILAWLAEVAAFAVVLHAFGAQVDFAAASFIVAFAMLIGGLPIFPGGLGGVEATMVGLLALLNVDWGTAAAVTALFRLATLWLSVLLGWLALPFALRSAER